MRVNKYKNINTEKTCKAFANKCNSERRRRAIETTYIFLLIAHSQLKGLKGQFSVFHLSTKQEFAVGDFILTDYLLKS